MKPCVIPVRLLPFNSITDAKVRELRDELKAALISCGLFVVGFVMDGEWNSIRTQGSCRPVSIIQLMANARKEAKKTNIKVIKEYFTLSSGVPKKVHPAIPRDDLQVLESLCANGKSRVSNISFLTCKVVPFSL